MKWTHRILSALGLRFDPDTDGVSVPGIRTTVSEPKDIRRTPTDMPADIVADRVGGRVRQFTDREDGIDWDTYNVRGAGRRADIRQEDLLAIEWSNATKQGAPIQELRYRELKPVYAKGLTTDEAAALSEFKGKRGYGSRTLDNYWAAMTEADNDCPTARLWAVDGANAAQLGGAIHK